MKNEKWKKGSLTLEFCLLLPIFFAFIFALLGLMQRVLARNELDKAVYFGARAASICEDSAEAERQFAATVKQIVASSVMGVSPDDIDVKVELVAGTSEGAGKIKWEKGAMINCSATVNFSETSGMIVTRPMSSTSDLCVMVERPATTYY